MAGAPLPSDSCLYALSSNGSRAFQVAGGSFTTGCSIAVASTNNEAFQLEGQITLNLNNRAQVAVVGGSALNGNVLRDTVLNQNVSPISITTPADPLASLIAPATGTIVRASATNYDNNNPPPGNTLSPGVYCGGLRIGSTNNVTYTMSPGVYVMAGGGFKIESQGRLSGTGVTIYTTTGTGWGCGANGNSPYTPVLLSGQAIVNLSAPATGSLAGVLFMGSRTACATLGGCEHKIESNTAATLNGALYFPRDAFKVSGQATVTGRVMVVADRFKSEGSTWNTGLNPYVPIGVAVTPGTAALVGGQTQQFTATVTNTNYTNVTWTVVSGGGSMSAAGLYTAPVVGAQTTVTVRATSVADVSKSATATVTVNPTAAVSVSVTPGTATL